MLQKYTVLGTFGVKFYRFSVTIRHSVGITTLPRMPVR